MTPNKMLSCELRENLQNRSFIEHLEQLLTLHSIFHIAGPSNVLVSSIDFPRFYLFENTCSRMKTLPNDNAVKKIK